VLKTHARQNWSSQLEQGQATVSCSKRRADQAPHMLELKETTGFPIASKSQAPIAAVVQTQIVPSPASMSQIVATLVLCNTHEPLIRVPVRRQLLRRQARAAIVKLQHIQVRQLELSREHTPEVAGVSEKRRCLEGLT
jgi:hypothetical protein